MGRRQIICLGLIGLICFALPTDPAFGRSTTVSVPDPEVMEGGFRLHGSHGYLISVSAYSEGGDQRGSIEFTVTRRGTRASYRAPASVTADAIHADLGPLGKVDVLRIPSGRQKTVHPKCFGGLLTYEPATYEGLIEFNGEQGYTRAQVSRVAQIPALLVFIARGSCGSGRGEAISSEERGARLRGISFSHGRSLSFQVNKNSAKGRTVFTASLKERRGRIWITRELTGAAAPGAFRFDPHLQTATLSPSAPFSGSASLSRSKSSVSPIWTGNLRLAFPGRPAVSLAGPSVYVGLVHAHFTVSRGPEAEIGG